MVQWHEIDSISGLPPRTYKDPRACRCNDDVAKPQVIPEEAVNCNSALALAVVNLSSEPVTRFCGELSIQLCTLPSFYYRALPDFAADSNFARNNNQTA